MAQHKTYPPKSPAIEGHQSRKKLLVILNVQSIMYMFFNWRFEAQCHVDFVYFMHKLPFSPTLFYCKVDLSKNRQELQMYNGKSDITKFRASYVNSYL